MDTLELKKLRVGSPKTGQLFEVSMVLAPGALIAVMGPSGCGKTMLLRTITGLSAALGGRQFLAGRAPQQWGWPAWRRRIALVPQSPVLASTTVRENLEHPFVLAVHKNRTPQLEIDEGLELMGLSSALASRDAQELSIGEKQRIALLRALRLSPDFLLLDEPTSALDTESKKRVEDAVLQQKSKGLGILLITHDAAQKERLSTASLDIRAQHHNKVCGSFGGSQ